MREQALPAVLVILTILPMMTMASPPPSAEAETTPKYQVTTQGFLKVLKRSEPLVLFRTKIGIQALTGNHTCIDDHSSVYYTVNKKVDYFSYSSVENYMMMITSDKQVCFRNLYKSDWNNAINRDMRRECLTHNFATIRLYGLSINHHVVFALSDKRLFGFSMSSPMCGFLVQGGGGGGAQLHGVTFLHVTNFVRSQDRILLAYAEKLEEYTPSGDLLTTLRLTDPGEVLVSIDSDEAPKADTYFFLYIQNRTDAMIRRFTTSFNDSASVVIFTAADRTAQSIDVSSGLMAILMRERVYASEAARRRDHFTERDYVLQLRGSYPTADNASLDTFVCSGSGAQIDEVIMVNQRRQRDVFYCKENPRACQNLGAYKMCDAAVILRPSQQFTMSAGNSSKELHRKLLFTSFIGGLTLSALLCYHFAEYTWRI